MQREIKFRAWDSKKMVSDSEAFARMWVVGFGGTVREVHGETNWVKKEHNHGIRTPDPKPILMQYTGLKDKNGKEIYEGDIVMLGGSKEPKVMEFKGGSFILGHIYHGTEAYRMEIIGNIYEHPDLLR